MKLALGFSLFVTLIAAACSSDPQEPAPAADGGAHDASVVPAPADAADAADAAQTPDAACLPSGSACGGSIEESCCSGVCVGSSDTPGHCG